MAVSIEHATRRFRGLSTDAKPGLERDSGHPDREPPVGSVFTEIDTGRRFIYTRSGDWQRQEQTVETLLSTLIDVNESILAQLESTHRGLSEYQWDGEEAPEE